MDLEYLVKNLDEVNRRLKSRDGSLDLSGIINNYDARKRVVRQLNELMTTRKQISREYESSKDQRLLGEAEEVKQNIKRLEDEQRHIEGQLDEELSHLPNIPHISVPTDAQTIARQGGQKRKFDFEPKDHVSVGVKLGLFDFERATKIASQKFVVYTDRGAELEWALQQYFLDRAKQNSFSLLNPPLLVNERSLRTTGQLPKFEEQLYVTQDSLYLIPTVEVSLVAFHMDDELNRKDLPIRYTAFTPNFRREAGAAGKRDKGLIRMHQFCALEMVMFDTPEHSYASLDEMVNMAANVAEDLEIPYRVVLLPTWDLPHQSAKTYDVEVYLPSSDEYREASSCSNCEDYQARRGNIRFRDDKGKLNYVHTLNGTGLATSRTLPAILENYQQKDGTVLVPQKLIKYFGGREIIEPR